MLLLHGAASKGDTRASQASATPRHSGLLTRIMGGIPRETSILGKIKEVDGRVTGTKAGAERLQTMVGGVVQVGMVAELQKRTSTGDPQHSTCPELTIRIVFCPERRRQLNKACVP